MRNLLCVIYLTAVLESARAYTPLPRWGQATALIANSLFCYSGKSDEFNSFSYTSAPNTDELLYLPLSSSFDLSAPPWELVGTRTPWKGMAWASLTPVNTTHLLLFGGAPGPDSPVVEVGNSDSGVLLEIATPLEPHWLSKPRSWTDEPPRRIHHTATTSPTGQVYLIGGERADNSRFGYSDHQIFNPSIPSFSPLPTDGAPPAIFGHASILLGDGKLLVFGGYESSEEVLLSFSQIWVLDTKASPMTWSIISTSNSSLPEPRRAFAATCLSNNRILIHGGCDAVLQQNFDDGWILDLGRSPPTWSRLESLSQLGARRDHFAYALGDQVLFGFGYGENGGASASLALYDVVKDSFSTSFTPPPPPTSQTVPGPLPTHGGNSPTKPGQYPNGPSDPDGNNNSENSSSRKKASAAAIAVGVILGLLALIAGGLVTAYVVRRRRSQDQRFHPLGDSESYRERDGSIHMAGQIPTAGHHDDHRTRILHSLGVSHLFAPRTLASQYQRRDMLADEDTREFGQLYGHHHHEGTQSTTWSLKNMIGSKTPARPSREPSYVSTPLSVWQEKVDPFADNTALLRDDEIGYTGVALQDAHRQHATYSSSQSQWSSNDPFVDPVDEQIQTVVRLVEPDSQPQHPPLPLVQLESTTDYVPPSLSTLSERPSSSTLDRTSKSSLNQSQETALSPFEPMSRVTSTTSQEHQLSPRSMSPRTRSIIGIGSVSSTSVRRSDSWWSRLNPAGLLDRRTSDASRRSAKPLEIRDPNPIPLLGAIAEFGSVERFERPSEHPKSVSRVDSRKYGANNTSRTSFKTTNSEALDQLAGNMHVVQRLGSRSRHRTGSTGTLSIDTQSTQSDNREQSEESVTFTSPVDMDDALPTGEVRPPPSALTTPVGPRPMMAPKSPSGAIAARIQAYERRATQEQEGPPSPTNTRQREERFRKPTYNVHYGLAPRPNLYVANPDRASRDST